MLRRLLIGGSGKRGISSAGRAPDLHSGGQRFDPARLHHPFSLTTQPFAKGCVVQLDELTSYREITTSELLIPQVREDHLAGLSDQKGNFVQVKYTNLRASLREDVTIYPSSEPALGWESNAFVPKKLVFFWIKSSARRAFGECLGSKRR